MKLAFTIDYEASEDSGSERVLDEIVTAEARKFVAAVADALEDAGVEDVEISLEGD